ncbi:unnamed protein product, partial [Candidula unifasciata]
MCLLLQIMTMFSGHPTAINAESNKSKKPEEWTHRFTQKLMSMEDALSVLYDGLEKDDSGSVTDATLTDRSFLEVATDFLQHCQNLICMISEPTNGPVRLPLGLLLDVVSRCLRVAYIDVTAVPSMSELAGILPELHRATLEILSQLVLSCKTSVLPHSRVIIDLCMQALTSARHMEISERSKTRACTYQVLCLLVRMFGWGKYMTRQCKSFIQELTADIKWENSAKQSSTAATQNSNKRQQDTVQGKKKGRKKKNKAESYVDLVKTNGTEDKNATDDDPNDLQMIIGALEYTSEVSRAEIGQGQILKTFYLQSLMRCIVDTAQMFYHEEPPADSPYTIAVCKRELHAAVFACATVRLEPGCSRKDAITHFQLTNLALSILVNGMQDNCCYEVQSVCRESLNILQITGCFNRPIIRRTQLQENVTTIDETELEVEKVRKENSSLQSRLLDSDLEIQMHKSMEASLRKELETLKATRSDVGTHCTDPIVYLTDPEDNMLLTNENDDMLENEIEQDESEEDETMMTRAATEITEEITEDTLNKQQSQAAEGTEQEEGTSQQSVDSPKLLTKRVSMCSC